jgi:F-type H+-transporting ATPase subunit b
MKNIKARLYNLIFWGLALAAALPANALASEESNKWGIWLDIGRVFNLALVVGLLVWATRKPLANFFSGRTQAIREQLEEAQKARKVAEEKLAEIESRMSRLDDELQEIKNSSEKEAREEYQRLVEAAGQDAEKALERSRQEIDAMTRTARQELKLHAAELAVKLAEEKIRGEITDADHERLLARFVTGLGEKQ